VCPTIRDIGLNDLLKYVSPPASFVDHPDIPDDRGKLIEVLKQVPTIDALTNDV
jgi:hypothetical protein